MADTFFEFCAGPLAEAGNTDQTIPWYVYSIMDGKCTLVFFKRMEVPVQRNFMGILDWTSEMQHRQFNERCTTLKEIAQAFNKHGADFPDCLTKELESVEWLPNNYYKE